MASEDQILNNGERLYYLNLAHGIVRQSKIEETKKNEEDNFTMEFKFQPRINKEDNDKYSNVQSKFRDSIPNQKFGEQTESSQKNKGIEPKTEEEIKNLTNRLHSEQQKFKENKEKLYKNQTQEECPFTPKINVQGKADPKYFMMRLEKWNKKMEEKIKKNEEGDKKHTVDAITGQKLFQPKVVDPVAKKLKRDNEDVHTDLYKKGLEHIDYRKKIMKPDTRDDLQRIENEKKAKITKLKEERDRYKKEKQEKFEKEVNERALKVKAEKENMEKIIKERINKEKKEDDKNKKPDKKNSKKGKDDKKEEKKNNIKKEIPAKIKFQKEKGVQKNLKNLNKPLSSNKRMNTDTVKLKSIKDNKNAMKKLPIKVEEKNKRAISQSPKVNKRDFSKQKEAKTKTNDSRKKKETLSKQKQIEGKEKRFKSAKNDKKNINPKIGEIELNNKKNKKEIIKKTIGENNIVSLDNKSKAVKKGKNVKK